MTSDLYSTNKQLLQNARKELHAWKERESILKAECVLASFKVRDLDVQVSSLKKKVVFSSRCHVYDQVELHREGPSHRDDDDDDENKRDPSIRDQIMQTRIINTLKNHNIFLSSSLRSLFLHADNVRDILNEHGIKCPEWLRNHDKYSSHLRPDTITFYV